MPCRALRRTFFNIVEKPRCLCFPQAMCPSDPRSLQSAWSAIYNKHADTRTSQLTDNANSRTSITAYNTSAGARKYIITLCTASLKDTGTIPPVDVYITLSGWCRNRIVFSYCDFYFSQFMYASINYYITFSKFCKVSHSLSGNNLRKRSLKVLTGNPKALINPWNSIVYNWIPKVLKRSSLKLLIGVCMLSVTNLTKNMISSNQSVCMHVKYQMCFWQWTLPELTEGKITAGNWI